MGESPEIELVRRAWDALIQGGPEVLGEVLAPDAQWYGVEDGQLCEGRKAIIDVMSRNLSGRLRGRIEETIQDGPRVIVAFRPEQPAQLDRPVDEGIAYMVVTIRDGRIVAMKGCADRSAAVSYAQGGEVRMDDNRLIGAKTPESRALVDRVKVATRLSSKLSAYCMDEAESIQKAFEELIGKSVGDSFTLIPPFYADYGLNITVGRAVFIGYECAFTGHGAINIADQVMIAHKVNLVTAGHPVEPDKRRTHITAEPITIDTNVWIGTAATILPGVRIGADAVVGAGAVVTHDVPPATLVAGVPATVIRHL
jgi:acetyltransferase-like isoleucine patch superfamily enzyme/ketosteroid isomerase-like protein